MAVVSGRMARADAVYISLERPGVPGARRSPGSAGGGSWLAHRSRIMLGVHGTCLNLALWTRAMVAITRLLDGRTQCMSLSAATEHSNNRQGLPGPHACLLRLAVAKHIVIVDSKVTVGRRRRHQAGMRRRRPQGQRSPLWPQSAAAWPLVPRSGTLECATLASVQTSSTISNAYVHMTHATRLWGPWYIRVDVHSA